MGDAVRLEIGEKVGSAYEVRAELPARGTTRRYAADDLLLARHVTLQVCDESSADALVREAKALAAVRHGGLPAVYGIGSHRGLAYLAMEPLDGTTLDAHIALRRNASSWFHVLEIVPVLQGVSETLAAIHAAGRAHGEVAASNVLITEDERVVLLRFGAIDLGDAASDIKAFGQLAFEMFIGEPPRDDEDDIAALRPDVSPALSDLIRMCLSPRASERPPLEAIADELRAVPRRRARRRSTINGPYRIASR
jgi:serine/threonine protein kinase